MKEGRSWGERRGVWGRGWRRFVSNYSTKGSIKCNS